MTGPYERGLGNLAEGGMPFDVPIVRDLIAKMETLSHVVDAAGQQPGIEGASAEAASRIFSTAAETIRSQIDYLENDLKGALDAANGVRRDAQERLASLPSGQLSSGQEAVVRGAATGTTLFLGPLAILAGEGAVQALNGYLSGQREEQAKRDYDTVSNAFTQLAAPPPPSTSALQGPETKGEDGRGPGSGSPSSGDSSSGSGVAVPSGGSGGWGGSAGTAPAFVPRGYDPGGSQPAPAPAHLVPDPDAPRGPGIDLGKVPHDYRPPTADGSIGGISTMPGYIPGSTPANALPGIHGGSGAGLGSGLSAGLVAGAGGAAALNKLGRLGSPSSSGENTAAGRGITGTGGLLGKTATAGTAGTGLGVRSGGTGLGGAVGGSTAGGGNSSASNARAAGTRASGGAPGATGNGTPTAAGGRGAAGVGAHNSRSDRKEHGRGLGGPIAPRMEDDEEIAPRSHNAAAGSRDE